MEGKEEIMTANEPETLHLEKCLIRTFNDEELNRFCYHYFREVYDLFADRMTRTKKIHELISYCDRRGRLEDLRQLLQKERPGCFQGGDASARPATELPPGSASMGYSRQGERGGFMNKKTMLELFGVIAGVVTIVAFVISIVDFGDFAYQVRVLDEDGTGIAMAEVTIMVDGITSLSDLTDNFGFTRIPIDASRVGQPGRLIVAKSGYQTYKKYIVLTQGIPPDEIRLERTP
jgi:hypothetical protein